MLTLYCNSYRKNLPLNSQFDQKTLMCGAIAYEKEMRDEYVQLGYLMDDEGEHISHLNYWLGDLTGTYWVWKNAKEEFIGMNHYRRFWNESEIGNLRENTLYVPKPYPLDSSLKSHHEFFNGTITLEILEKVILEKRSNLDISILEILNSKNDLYMANSFFGHREVFNIICDKVFPTIFECLKDYLVANIPHPYHHPSVDGSKDRYQQRRGIAYLAERIISAILIDSQRYLPGIDTVPVTLQHVGINESYEYVKGYRDLAD
jgi:hypothetical protein